MFTFFLCTDDILKNHLSRTIIKLKKIFTIFYIILKDVYIYLIYMTCKNYYSQSKHFLR
jgi:hypothetical protein